MDADASDVKTIFRCLISHVCGRIPQCFLLVCASRRPFVATQGPFSIDYQALAKRLEDPVVKADLASIHISSDPADFLSYMLMGPDEISAYLAANPSDTLNTDDNAYLEYHTPFEFLSLNRTVVAGLVPYAGLDLKIIRNLPDGDKQRLLASWLHRRDQIVGELRK